MVCQVLQGAERKEVKDINQDSVYKSTQEMLRSIINLTQGLGPLPSTAFVSMKLLYYDDVTPEDYEPAGFRPASDVSRDNKPSRNINIGVGEVCTGHHTVKLRVQARQVENVTRHYGV